MSKFIYSYTNTSNNDQKPPTLKPLYFPLILLIIFLLLAVLFSCSHAKTKEPVSIEYFKPGQILLPDYACSDTLVVVDAVGLNKAIAYVEQFNDTLVETDDEIDSVFHIYCTVK